MRNWSSRLRGALRWIGGALVPCAPAPAIGTFVLGVSAGELSSVRFRRAALLASPFIVLALVQVTGGRTGAAALLAEEGVLVLVVSLTFVGNRRLLPSALLGGIVAMCALLGYGWWVGAHAWSSYDPLSSWQQVRWTGSELLTGHNSRQWRLEGVGGLQLGLAMRLVAGDPAWAWAASDARFAQVHVGRGNAAYTRVVEPSGGDPFLSRTYYGTHPLGGRTFRFATELRLEGSARPTSTSISATGMRGRYPIALTRPWQKVDFTWTVPTTVDEQNLRIVLEHFFGLTFDVKGTRLYERVRGTWVPREPLVGNGVDVYLSDGRTLVEKKYLPTASWQRIQLTHTGGRALTGRITGVVRVGPGLTVAVRDTRLTGAGPKVGRVRPVLRHVRQRLWYPQPNLLGHSLAAAALGWLALTGTSWFAPLVWLGACVAVALTGSRSALLALVLAGLILLMLGSGRRNTGRWLRVTAASAMLLGLLVVAARSGYLRLGADFDVVSRPQIWSVALRAMEAKPLLGIGADQFQDYFQEMTGDTSSTTPMHAHNQWLNYGVDYGIPGVVAILLFTGLLCWYAWRGARLRGLAFVVGIGLLEVFDTTLLYSTVLLPVLLTLNLFPGSSSTASAGGTRSRVPHPHPGEV